jgi:hypothetical protein
VDLFEQIRRDRQREETYVRELARRYGVHRQKVRQALRDAIPPTRKPYVREAPTKLDPAKPFIDAMLLADLEAPRKQRHTVRRILARLIDEHEITGLTYSNVRNYVARRRPEILAEAGKLTDNGFVPQTHEPGAEAEVDFAELWVYLAGVLTKCSCSPSASAARARPCTGCSPARDRSPSWRATSTRSRSSGGPRRTRCATTT